MLRGSSETAGAGVNLETVVAGRSVDSEVPGGDALIRFTEAVLGDGTELAAARDALVRELGERRMVDAAGVVGNFQRMVRIADSTGIPVDGAMAESMREVREFLGLNELPSARLG
ncbi:MAG: hypothetical protein P8Y69_00335 [Gammaproteobacteria bacterium]|jgi:hypothetical protein